MIIINNEEAIRVKCEDVLPEEINELVLVLEDELKRANNLGKNGIGLAAPQIGIAKNIAIVRIGQGYDINLINAKIKNGYDSAIFRDEGCLSFPNRLEITSRFQEIHVEGSLGFPYNFIATGFFAVACQHEIDHLNSTLFMDRAIPKIAQLSNKSKIRPNDKCNCGSNIKYKKCCGR